MKNYSITRTLEGTYDATKQDLVAGLKEQGFGVLTHIDMKATLAEKLGVDFRRYEILGACNPPLAHSALQASLEVGVLLPCNVLLYEDDAGKTVVSAMDPGVLMGEDAPEALQAVAQTARAKLLAALERLK